MAFAKINRVLIVLLASVYLLGCNDDDLKNVSTVSSKKITLTKDRSYDVEVIYSDSSKVKAKGFAPILDKVTPSVGNLYNEMPKGVDITFYDQFMKKTGSLRSDYAISRDTERITIFRKNVVVVSEGMTFTTDELTWNQNTATYTSPYGTVKGKDGSLVSGTQFSAPQDFSTYSIVEASGQTYFNGQLGQ